MTGPKSKADIVLYAVLLLILVLFIIGLIKVLVTDMSGTEPQGRTSSSLIR